MKDTFSICAIIPTYNNGKTIVDVVERTYQQLKDVIVVVDGSTDDTLQQLQSLHLPIDIVVLPCNGGKGCALKVGFSKAIERGFDYALTLDGDGQHYPEDIPLLIDELSLHVENTMIIGSRGLKQENMPTQNTFANKFSNFWFTLQTGLRLPDTQSGMRIYPLHHLGHYQWITSRYESELELLVFAAWRNLNIYPVPIRVYYPPKRERVSHFKPVYDFTRISILNTFLCVLAIVYGLPSRYWRTIWCIMVICGACWYMQLWGWWFVKRKGYTDSTYERFHNKFQKVCVGVARHIADIPVRYTPSLETITPPQSPVMYISNHTSLHDVILIFALHPKLVMFVKRKFADNPLFKVVLKYTQCIVTDTDMDMLLPQCQVMIDKGYSIVIFPEGTRTGDGDIHRFHKGTFYIAEKLHLPIQPLLIRGAFDELNRQHLHVNKSSITIEHLPLVTPEDTSLGIGYRERTKNFEQYYRMLIRREQKNI